MFQGPWQEESRQQHDDSEVAAAKEEEEEESRQHLFLICPLYERLRRRIPFQAAGILVEGHPLHGEGCTTRNLAALMRAILAVPRRDSIIDLLCEAIRLRREYRQGL